MKKNTRLIILSILAVLIVIVLTFGITSAFLKPVVGEDKVVEVNLSSCAKIKLKGTNSSINLKNSHPMSRNRGLQTTPYSFTVSSSCGDTVNFNIYLATLSSNTLDAANIHYILTSKGSKTALVEGTLTGDDASNDFSDNEKTELNTGLGSSCGKIFNLYSSSLTVDDSSSYDLYLYVDENATDNQNESATFAAGVAIKTYNAQ